MTIRCIPVDGSPVFEIEPATRCIGRRTERDASLRPPHVATTAAVRILDGEVRWPFEVAPAIITVDGAEEQDNCICAEHAIYCDVGAIDGNTFAQHYVERPNGTWLACRIESWRERAERLECALREIAEQDANLCQPGWTHWARRAADALGITPAWFKR